VVKRPSAIPFAEAARIWRRYGLADPSALVLEDLAVAMGVLVIDDTLDSADARLVRNNMRGLIRVREGLAPPGRRRFAIAHELGHWVLHAKESQLSVCTSDDMIADYKKSRLEAEANSFASALLMPADLFRDRRGDGGPTIRKLDKLAAFFGTSLTATAIRWMDLASDYCAVVVSAKGNIVWWRGSEEFEDAFWIESGHAVSRYSAAHQVDASRPAIGPVETGIDAWAQIRGDIDTDIFVEDSLLLGSHEKVLTVLWLP
jgi:Zn-dependent peptidase ImmA (M78 family)